MPKISEPRQKGSFALFNLGFRPFFLGAAGFAVCALFVWAGMYYLGWEVQAGLPGIIWHGHEMIYGYGMAVVAGFLLTAVGNWTGRRTLYGGGLATLFTLWAAARVLPFFGESALLLWAVLDNLFLLGLFISLLLPVWKAKQWANIGIITKVFLLFISNIVFYLGLFGALTKGVYWGLYSGLYLLIALILTMGRRVIPFFIEKGVGYPVQLKNWKWLDISSLVLFLCFWAAMLLVPYHAFTALLSGALFILHSIRIAAWHTPGIWQKPLLWVLYLAYAWIILGFALQAGVFLFGISPYLPLHAFAAGGIGMVTIGMMCRVALGHTGRSVFNPPASLGWMFTALIAGALLRVIAPLLLPWQYWMLLSQILWAGAFALYVYFYAGMLVRE